MASWRTVTDDDGHAISYKVLPRGTPVWTSDGVEIGQVREVLENEREHIFDGIVVEVAAGQRFVDAPEVARIAERWVTLTISAAEAAELPPPGGGMRQRVDHAKTVRRAKRWGRGMRERWDRR